MDKPILIIGIVLVVLIIGVVMHPSKSSGVGNVMMGGLGSTGMMGMLYQYGESTGIFSKHSLNVTYVSFNDPYTAVLALLTGKIDLFFSSPGLTAHSLNEDGSFRIGMAVAFSEMALLTRPEIKTVQDLKGKSLGVVGTTSDSYYITKWWLESKGINMEQDIQIVEIKNPASLTSYYLTGQLDAIVIWGLFAGEVKDSGAVVLVTQTECLEDLIGHPYYVPIALLSNDLVDHQPSLAKNLMNAFKDITEEIEKDKEEAARYLSELTGESHEAVMANIEMKMIGELDESIIEDLMAYFEYATEKGFITAPPGKDVFYRP